MYTFTLTDQNNSTHLIQELSTHDITPSNHSSPQEVTHKLTFHQKQQPRPQPTQPCPPAQYSNSNARPSRRPGNSVPAFLRSCVLRCEGDFREGLVISRETYGMFGITYGGSDGVVVTNINSWPASSTRSAPAGMRTAWLD